MRVDVKEKGDSAFHEMQPTTPGVMEERRYLR